MPAEVTEEGVQLVEDMLKAWAARVSSLDSTVGDDEDVVMADDMSPEAQLQELKACFAEFQPRMEKNQWVQQLLTSL